MFEEKKGEIDPGKGRRHTSKTITCMLVGGVWVFCYFIVVHGLAPVMT